MAAKPSILVLPISEAPKEKSTIFEINHTFENPMRNEKNTMEIELAKCDCCGLKEDCTQDYITEVKAKFEGKWLCGLCSEAVRDEVNRGNIKPFGMEEAVRAHMSFCRKYKSNPATRVADGMRQMLRRRRSGENISSSSSSSSPSPSPSKKYYYSRSTATSQVGDESSFHG